MMNDTHWLYEPLSEESACGMENDIDKMTTHVEFVTCKWCRYHYWKSALVQSRS